MAVPVSAIGVYCSCNIVTVFVCNFHSAVGHVVDSHITVARSYSFEVLKYTFMVLFELGDQSVGTTELHYDSKSGNIL